MKSLNFIRLRETKKQYQAIFEAKYFLFGCLFLFLLPSSSVVVIVMRGAEKYYTRLRRNFKINYDYIVTKI